jgi:MoxR-like ATPase
VKSIYEMKEALRDRLLLADAHKRPEMLIRLTLLWAASANFRGTADDFTRVMEDLRQEFEIPESEIHDAVMASDLMGDAWKEAGDIIQPRLN